MEFLLDTNALVRYFLGKLNLRSKRMMESQAHIRYVSHVTLWEVAIKTKLATAYGITTSMVEAYVDQRAQWLSIQKEHIVRTTQLPRHHGEPYDRLLIAQAMTEKLTVLSSDRIFQQYGGLDLRML